VIALITPLLPVALWLLWLGKSADHDGLVNLLTFAIPGVVAAQSGVLAFWGFVQRRARAKQSAALAGVFSTLVVWAAAGVVAATIAGWDAWSEGIGISGWIVQSIFFAFASMMFAGWLSVPLAALAAHWAGRQREKEFGRESV
jgi:hypothetical protein